MARQERQVFSYKEHKLSTTRVLSPRNSTPEDWRRILNEHVGKNSTFLIKTRNCNLTIFPQAFRRLEEKPQEAREVFFSLTVNHILQAKRVIIASSVNFSNN